MLKQATRMRRSPTQWGLRLVLAAIAAWLGYGAVTHSLAYVMRGQAPERAHAWAPNDGRITAILAEQRLGASASAGDRAEAHRLARLALRQDATAVTAVATLGINAAVRNDALAARRWFEYSQALSRRDLRTQLWAIEDAVGRNSIPEALRHYDIALRTSRFAPDILFPILSSAIADPKIRHALVRTLAARPTWTTGFIGYAAVHGADPKASALLFRALPSTVPVSDAAKAEIIARLIAAKQFDAAWSYYTSIRAGAARQQSRDPRFVANLEVATSFDWNAMEDGGGIGSIQRGNIGGIATFEAPQSTGGTVLRQAQMLPQGTYRLEGHASGIEQVPDARPYWSLTCVDGRQLGQVALPNSSEAQGRFAGVVQVPANCPLQYLSLILRPSDASDGVSGQIEAVRLRPVD